MQMVQVGQYTMESKRERSAAYLRPVYRRHRDTTSNVVVDWWCHKSMIVP